MATISIQSILATLSTLLGVVFSPTDHSGMYFNTQYVTAVSWEDGKYAVQYNDPDTTLQGEWLQVDFATFDQINGAIFADHSPISGELNKSAEGRYVLTIEN